MPGARWRLSRLRAAPAADASNSFRLPDSDTTLGSARLMEAPVNAPHGARLAWLIGDMRPTADLRRCA